MKGWSGHDGRRGAKRRVRKNHDHQKSSSSSLSEYGSAEEEEDDDYNDDDDSSFSEDSSIESSIDESESSYDESSQESRCHEETANNLPKPPPSTSKQVNMNYSNREQKKNNSNSNHSPRKLNYGKNVKTVPLRRNSATNDEGNKRYLHFQRHTGKKLPLSSSSSPSIQSVEDSSSDQESISMIESQRKQAFYDSSYSSYQESFPGSLKYDDSSGKSIDLSSSSESRGGSSRDNHASIVASGKNRRRRSGRQRFEDTISSISIRTSSLVQRFKRPDHIFLIMASGIFIVCAAAAYVYYSGLGKMWIIGSENHIMENVPSFVPTTYPSIASSSSSSEGQSNTPTTITSTFLSGPTIISSQWPSFLPTINSSTSKTNSNSPTIIASRSPSFLPTFKPTQSKHFIVPTVILSRQPSLPPTIEPTVVQSSSPSVAPTINPSSSPTNFPSGFPSASIFPSQIPSNVPTKLPTLSPSISNIPTISQVPSSNPTEKSCSCTPKIYKWKLNLTNTGCHYVVSNSKGITDVQCYNFINDSDIFEPDVITEISIQEFGPDMNVIKGYTRTEEDLRNGDAFQFESVTMSGQISIGLMCNLTALNTQGESLHVFGFEFSFSNICEEPPFQVGDSIGFLEFVEEPEPSADLCFYPTEEPSIYPTLSSLPSIAISLRPTNLPSQIPTTLHTDKPSPEPSSTPSVAPSLRSSRYPSVLPSITSTFKPSLMPSVSPSQKLSTSPSHQPSIAPTSIPSLIRSVSPSHKPSGLTSNQPSKASTSIPSLTPSILASNVPSYNPSSSPSTSYVWDTLAPIIYGSSSSKNFGAAVACARNGNTIVVGQKSVNQVTVYDLVNNNWMKRGDVLVGPPFSGFGTAVSISNDGKIIAIGAYEYIEYKGIVEVWHWNEASWIQRGSRLYGEYNDEGFGVTLKMSPDGTHLIIGCSEYGNEWKGSVRMFHYNDGDWVQQGGRISGDPDDDFGSMENLVSITDDGQYIAIAAASANYVKCFSWNGNDWYQMGSTLHDQSSGGYGWSVALVSPSNGEFILAVGAPKEGEKGAVHIFDWVEFDWTERQDSITTTVGYLEEMGGMVVLSPDAMTVLSTTNLAVLAFDWNGSNWIQRGDEILKLSGDPFGRYNRSIMSIDFSQDTNNVIVGIPNDDDGLFYGNNTGQVRSFQWRRNGQ